MTAALSNAADPEPVVLHRLTNRPESNVRRWHQSWCRPGAQNVPDYTGGKWLSQCDTRQGFALPGRGYALVTCTRRSGHTGRHAAGYKHIIVAVWEGQPNDR